MPAEIIDGKGIARRVRENVADHVARIKQNHNVTPGLAVVLVGRDPASEVYVRNKARHTLETGMASFEHRLSENTTQRELVDLIAQLNADGAVHGILVQLPLPAHLDAGLVINTIDPAKDVDGFHIYNVGRRCVGGKANHKALVPCTPLGCLMLLQNHHKGDLGQRDAVVIGRSNIVGKPMAQLLLDADCTVTIARSRTRDLAATVRRADIVVAAVGRAGMVKGDWIKPGATVIDVGINRVTRPDGGSRIVGDCDHDTCAYVAGAITPVPGGVGPMTIACLLANCLTACCRIHALPEPGDMAGQRA